MNHELPEGIAPMYRQLQRLRHSSGPRDLTEAELDPVQAHGDPLETMRAMLIASGVELGDPLVDPAISPAAEHDGR